jgi:hypothetical protein
MRLPDENYFWAKVKRGRGCWLWQASLDSSGRGQIACAQENGKVRNFRAARVAWMLTYGDVPDGLLVLHKCDVKRCCRPDHLELGDKRKNGQDAYDRNLVPHSERHHWAKLNNADVRKMRRLRERGMKQEALAEMFGVDRSLVSMICARKVWKHV